ncbi:MAG: peptide ABC transporter substrate-binding protein [Erythrobacter sp.]|nr:peptide ABC transporter substrate-binding protein [Erythrobacter sp.]
MRSLAIPAIIFCLALAGCSSRANEGAVSIAVIGAEDAPFETGNRLSYAGQLVREGTSEGLVAINAQGDVVPAIAERWIFTDDGLSFFFRIRNADWPSGEDLDAASVRQAMLDTIGLLDGTSLGLDLEKIDEIRVMADRVLEIRLKSPMPEFLQLLAQPELGLLREGRGTGPMRRLEEEDVIRLQAVPPQERGLPERRGWEDKVLDVIVLGMEAERAVEAFRNGEVEVVLNGRLSTFPLSDIGPLSGGSLRLDAALGLFGLVFRNTDGVLASAARREALSMAIDRSSLLQPFNVTGWEPSSSVVPDGFFTAESGLQPAWINQSLPQRRMAAAARISAWEREEGKPATLDISLPPGPGSDLLYGQLLRDFAAIGVQLVRVEPGKKADLALVDKLARYAGARWYLNQFNCDVSKIICSPDADVLVDQSLYAATPAEADMLLIEAANAMLARQVFIPLGAPLRWGLLRGGVDGFVENRWGRHPLFPMAIAPIS